MKSILRRAYPILLTALVIPSLLNCSGDAGNADNKTFMQGKADAEVRFGQDMLREGDIIFHQSRSDQSEAVRIATNSRFSHMAVIFNYKGKFVVFEAVQPVKITQLEQFIRRGNSHFVIKRLRDYDEVMTPDVITVMKEMGKSYMGRDYDIYFRWDDKRIYCSELVWKLYKQSAGIEVGRLQKASELNLDNPVVQRLIRIRYGRNSTIPPDEIVISPQSIYECSRLVTVWEQ